MFFGHALTLFFYVPVDNMWQRALITCKEARTVKNQEFLKRVEVDKTTIFSGQPMIRFRKSPIAITQSVKKLLKSIKLQQAK